MTAPMLRFDLKKRLGEVRLHCAGSVAMGSACALSGPSGAGKTSLLRMIAGLEKPDAGQLVIGSETWFDSARGIDVPVRERGIGMVFQDYALFPHLDVRGNLAYGARRGDEAWIEELLAATGLVSMAGRRPGTLSGGQQQRVALARALVRKPSLLLLDEPLAALDAALRSDMQSLLGSLQQKLGLTVLMVSHDLGDVFRMASQVLRMEGGQVVKQGSPAEVFLDQRQAGRLALRAQVLAVRRDDVAPVVSLLAGGQVIDVLADEEDVAGLAPGDHVDMATQAFSPILIRRMPK